MKHIKEIKRLARDAELDLIEHQDGRIVILGGIQMVTWWPYSKRMTAYADKAPRGVRFAMPKTVIAMANGAGETA